MALPVETAEDGRPDGEYRGWSESSPAPGGAASRNVRRVEPLVRSGAATFRTAVRVLALDYGTRRIGIAVSDPDQRIATPEAPLVRRGLEKDLAALEELIEAREIGHLVVGQPLHMSGRVGPEAEAAQAFGERLASRTGLPLDLFDERWTTLEARRALRESGRRGARQRQVVDSVAAALLLRAFLERKRARMRCEGAEG
jgi:putative Holliday junction resolvase